MEPRKQRDGFVDRALVSNTTATIFLEGGVLCNITNFSPDKS
jgi:hypothetical protein